MNKKLSKKLGTAFLVGSLVLPSVNSLVMPITANALTNYNTKKDVKLTVTERSNEVKAELEDYYNHLDNVTEIAFSQTLSDKLKDLSGRVDDLVKAENFDANKKSKEITSLFNEFSLLTTVIDSNDLNIMNKNYGYFDKIFYTLYQASDSITDIDIRATVQLTACRDLYYGTLVGAQNTYFKGYAEDIEKYNNIPELKYTYTTFAHAYDSMLHTLQNNGLIAGEDEELTEDQKGSANEIIDKGFKNYPINANVGLTDADVDKGEETPTLPDKVTVDETDTKEKDDDSFWDKISDFVDSVVKTLTGESDDSYVNTDTNYVSYETNNGCYVVTKTYDENGKLKNTQKVKGTSNSELLYCSISKASANTYPETPNISRYSLNLGDNYDVNTEAIAYTLNKTLPNPQYYKTSIKINDGVISYDDAVDLAKQVITKANGSYVDDGDESMFMLEGKLFVIKKTDILNREYFDNLSENFKYVSFGFVSINEDNEDEEQKSKKTTTVNVDTLTLQGKKAKDVTVYVKNEQFMLPVEDVVKALGGTVKLDKDNNATIEIENSKFYVKNSSNYIYTKNTTFTLMNKNEVSGSKLCADLQSMLEAVGYKYTFDADAKTLDISKN